MNQQLAIARQLMTTFDQFRKSGRNSLNPNSDGAVATLLVVSRTYFRAFGVAEQGYVNRSRNVACAKFGR
jgi:hypothetical protein